MKTVDAIQDMILNHIAEIDSKITNYHKEVDASLLQAKSQALLALAELKGASR